MITRALAAEDHHDSGETDEDIDDPLDVRPGAEEHVHDVQVATEETAEADEAPVEGADDNENADGPADGAFVFEHKGEERGRIAKIVALQKIN